MNPAAFLNQLSRLEGCSRLLGDVVLDGAAAVPFFPAVKNGIDP